MAEKAHILVLEDDPSVQMLMKKQLTAHGFKVTGTGPARMLLLASPGGFEQFVVELSEPLNAAPSEHDMQKLVATAARFDIQILGPLPE